MIVKSFGPSKVGAIKSSVQVAVRITGVAEFPQASVTVKVRV